MALAPLASLAPIDPLLALPDATLARFKEALVQNRYDDDALATAERVAPGQFDAIRLPLVRWALEKQADPRSELALLLAYDTPRLEAGITAVLGAPLVSALVAAGVLARDHDKLRSQFRLLPLDQSHILSDDPTAGSEAVMGPGPTTWKLLQCLPPKLSGDVLDLGCGAGTLALAAARRTKGRVVGTDVNPRAIAMARFNARLNGLAITFQAGDLYAPVADERFACLVCQPPYVIQPPTTEGVTFLHGGALGDALIVRALAGASERLQPGGRAIFLFDTPVLKTKPLHARVREALGAAPVDLLLITAPGPSPDLQAVAYASLEAPDFGPAYEEATLRYRQHIESLGVTEFTRVLAVVRAPTRDRPASAGFTASLAVPTLDGMKGDTIETAFASLDLACRDDSTLQASTVRLAPGARWIEERNDSGPEAEAHRSIRFATGWLCGAREVGDASAALVSALDRAPTIARAIDDYAQLCGATPTEVQAQVLDFVRQNLGRGLLVAG